MTLMHVYVRRANLTTKPRFENFESYMSEFPLKLFWKEYSRTKGANAKNFVHKRCSLVEFARLT